ncbi:hypothetical protein CRG98_026285 [Punica granatum]|nr:hypothetical protein CRG98_026285 [Punica granatum]
MALLLLSLLLLAITGPSSATYCVCKDGMSDQVLQKALDYACGAGADCSPILSSGACYQPNTVKSHCDYAVNSYFQRKGEAAGSCDFAGTATTSASAPSQSGSCVYPSSPSTTGGSSTTPPTGTTTPPTGTTTPTTTPGTPGTSTTPTTGTTTPSTTPTTTTSTTPSSTPSIYNSGTGLGPTGLTDSSFRFTPSWATTLTFLLLLPLFSYLHRA